MHNINLTHLVDELQISIQTQPEHTQMAEPWITKSGLSGVGGSFLYPINWLKLNLFLIGCVTVLIKKSYLQCQDILDIDPDITFADFAVRKVFFNRAGQARPQSTPTRGQGTSHFE